MLKIGVVQQSNSLRREENRKKIKSNIKECASLGAKLVVLQELHDQLYFCQTEDTGNFDLAVPIEGEYSDFYGSIARENQIVLVTSMFEKRAPGLYHNTAVVYEIDGSVAGIYRKMHIPDDPAYYEKFYFTPGDLGFKPIKTSVGTLGVLVCWDQWYPEAARLMAMAGADLLIYPTAIGWSVNDPEDEKIRQLNAWITIQRSHAIANGLHVVSANRTGFEADPSGVTDGLAFWGNSFVAGPQGEFLAQAETSSEQNFVVEIDFGRSESVRRWWPFLRDRRIDAYNEINRRYID